MSGNGGEGDGGGGEGEGGGGLGEGGGGEGEGGGGGGGFGGGGDGGGLSSTGGGGEGGGGEGDGDGGKGCGIGGGQCVGHFFLHSEWKGSTSFHVRWHLLSHLHTSSGWAQPRTGSDSVMRRSIDSVSNARSSSSNRGTGLSL